MSMSWTKNVVWQKWVGILSLALGAVALAGCSGTAGASTLPPLADLNEGQLQALGQGLGSGGGANAGITVTGTGVVHIDPDLAVLSLGVEGVAATVAEARNTAAQRMEAMLTALRDAGISDDDIETQRFQIRAQYDRFGNEQRLTGFQVTNTLTVKVRDLDSVGDVIDKAAAAGGDATRVNGITFTVEDAREAQDQARRLALQDAQAKADVYADQLGVARGSVLSLSETGSVPMPRAASLDMAFAMEAAGQTPIRPGEFAVTVNVQAVFGMQ